MNTTPEPRRAHSTFQWHVRGLALDLAALSMAAGAAILAGALALAFFAAIPRFMVTMNAINDPGHPAEMSQPVAMALTVLAVVFAAAASWHVFRMVARSAARALDRFALLPPTPHGER